MLKRFPTELTYQVFSLLIAIIIVHAIYVAVVRPNAQAFLKEETARMAADKDYVARQNVYVLIKDYEQETCFILMLWALALMAHKAGNHSPRASSAAERPDPDR